jgi:hypothetical protein
VAAAAHGNLSGHRAVTFTPQSLQQASARAAHGHFARWNARQYLANYYTRVESEERHTLRFIARQALHLSPDSVALEFGIGPTLHHLLPLAAAVAEIHVADLLQVNLQAISDWQQRAPGSHDWSDFTREVLGNEGLQNPTTFQIASRENVLRHKIKRYILADAAASCPAGIESAGRYDCVVSCYCADSATPSKRQWLHMMRNISTMVAPGGRIVLAALRKCSFYKVGDIHYPSADIDEQDMLVALRGMGCDPATIELDVQSVPDRIAHGFRGIILAAARVI